MNGTAWTEPGQGATKKELVDAFGPPGDNLIAGLPASFYAGLSWEDAKTKRTNLRLTGSPLTADDLKRIAEAK